MTTQQPEALRLADQLQRRFPKSGKEAAAELRRLHESNQELLAALKECIHFVEYDPKNVIGKQAKAAIAKAERTTP
jgi:ElaB/YqjD/DUF883 family membrane-anchored ribosome-binding protein